MLCKGSPHPPRISSAPSPLEKAKVRFARTMERGRVFTMVRELYTFRANNQERQRPYLDREIAKTLRIS